MGQIDVTDEGVIRAAPAVVFDAIMELMAGRGAWWAPHLFVRPTGEQTPDRVGSESVIRVPRRARFVARIEEVAAPTRLRVRYVSGDFRGDGSWTFEAHGHATRIRFRWQATPVHWWLRWLSGVVQRNHSRAMRLGFAALDGHLQSAQS